MNRLTERKNGDAFLKGVRGRYLYPDLKGQELLVKALNRLADYEDCGLSPEEVGAIIKGGGQYFTGVELFEIASALNELRKYKETEGGKTNKAYFELPESCARCLFRYDDDSKGCSVCRLTKLSLIEIGKEKSYLYTHRHSDCPLKAEKGENQ